MELTRTNRAQPLNRGQGLAERNRKEKHQSSHNKVHTKDKNFSLYCLSYSFIPAKNRQLTFWKPPKWGILDKNYQEEASYQTSCWVDYNFRLVCDCIRVSSPTTIYIYLSVFPINEGDCGGERERERQKRTITTKKICQSIRPFHSCTFLPPVTKREEEYALTTAPVTLIDITFF